MTVCSYSASSAKLLAKLLSLPSRLFFTKKVCLQLPNVTRQQVGSRAGGQLGFCYCCCVLFLKNKEQTNQNRNP